MNTWIDDIKSEVGPGRSLLFAWYILGLQGKRFNATSTTVHLCYHTDDAEFQVACFMSYQYW